jgi:HSP20 family protein
MNLVPWKNKSLDTSTSRFAPLGEIRSEMNRLFESFVREPFGALADSFGSQAWWPTLDIAESDQDITVRAEVPGVDPKEIDLTVTGDRLTIAGEKKETIEKKDRDVYHRESRYGRFSRTVQLPATVDPQEVSADYADGILTVTLKKTPGAVAKKIPVKTAS